ncbi:MAG: hypothetical protein WCC17_24670 [Candidatus Nitrosopolaris sp.]
MKFPKYSCSVCRQPSSRKWNLYRHISNCHAGIGNCVSNWDFPEDARGPHWNRWKNHKHMTGAINQKEKSHYIRPDLSNESNDTKPFDYQHVFTEAVLVELAKMAVSAIQPTQSRIPFPFSLMSSMQSPIGTYNADHTANLQIFGFRGYVCDKCLTAEAHYVAFPNAEGQGRIQAGHFCDPAKAAAASGLVDSYGMIRSLQDKIPTLIKQKVNSRNGNNNHLVALSLSNPKEDTIKLPNPADPSKPKIAFPYSEQTHLNLEPAKENKNKRDYLRRAITLCTTPLSDEELIDFLEHMRNATYGVVTVHNNTSEDNSNHDSLSYFVYIN